MTAALDEDGWRISEVRECQQQVPFLMALRMKLSHRPTPATGALSQLL